GQGDKQGEIDQEPVNIADVSIPLSTLLQAPARVAPPHKEQESERAKEKVGRAERRALAEPWHAQDTEEIAADETAHKHEAELRMTVIDALPLCQMTLPGAMVF